MNGGGYTDKADWLMPEEIVTLGTGEQASSQESQ